MGCTASRIDQKDDKVSACKERIRLMKHLMSFRQEFANAQLAYLRSLKNTGATLRQFTDSETLELENPDFDLALPPPPPPPPLPPSPPPLPPYSPDLRNYDGPPREEFTNILEVKGPKESTNMVEGKIDDNLLLPPPRLDSKRGSIWGPLEHGMKSKIVDHIEDEKWAGTNVVFQQNNNQEENNPDREIISLKERKQDTDMAGEDLSLSWYAKPKIKSTIAGITKELDEHFLRASAFGTELSVFMDIESLGLLHLEDNKRKKCNSSRVFTALSWSWSSKSRQVRRDSVDPSDPARPAAHCITLEKLYTEEQKLYKELKQEEVTRLELQKKSSFLQRQQLEDPEWEQIGKTRLNVERLQSVVTCLQQSIGDTCSSILKLIDIELQCQLIILTTGLMHMWRTMYECHQTQYQLSQHLNNLSNVESLEPTTEYHLNATNQLENEVSLWYNNFSTLVKSQKDYVRTLYQWLRLSDQLIDDPIQGDTLSFVQILCDDWQLALDSLPDQVVLEALRGFLSAIQSIVLQQEDEQLQQKKSDKLNKRLSKELASLSEMEAKLENARSDLDETMPVDPKHPLLVKRAKVEALRKEAGSERTKYENLFKLSHSMILSKLKISLPKVFGALMDYSHACAQVLERLYNHNEPTTSAEEPTTSIC